MIHTRNFGRYFISLMTALVTYRSSAQEVAHVTSVYFDEVRSGKYPPMPEQFLIPENANTLFSLLQPFLKDSLSVIRRKAYEIAYFVSSRSRIAMVRAEGVNLLVQACKNEEFGNIGEALNYLEEFPRQDFTNATKDSVRNLIKTSKAHLDQLFKLAGFLNLIDLKDEISPYMQPGNSGKLRWAAIVSLARLGDSFAVQEMMKRVSSLPVNDDLVDQIFPDLIYTRRPEALEYLINVLRSDAKNCTSTAENETPITCGYRIMEQLASVIEDFPIKLEASGDLQTNDYAIALTAVRHWLNTHKTYKILTNRF
jgi:hypothetical protein